MREVLLILHILGVTLGVGVSFAHLFLGISRSKMDPEEAKKDALRSLSLSLMGDIGISLLLVTGAFLIIPYWGGLLQNTLLLIKLGLVMVLVTILVIMKIQVMKIKKKQDMSGAGIIEKLGKFTLPIGIIIIILAVLIFN